MITGDVRQVADAVASELDIDRVLAEVLPEDKHSEVEKLQQQGVRVAMVGDPFGDLAFVKRSSSDCGPNSGTFRGAKPPIQSDGTPTGAVPQ